MKSKKVKQSKDVSKYFDSIFNKDTQLLKADHSKFSSYLELRPTSTTTNIFTSFNALCYAVYNNFEQLSLQLFPSQHSWRSSVPIRFQPLGINFGAGEYQLAPGSTVLMLCALRGHFDLLTKLFNLMCGQVNQQIETVNEKEHDERMRRIEIMTKNYKTNETEIAQNDINLSEQNINNIADQNDQTVLEQNDQPQKEKTEPQLTPQIQQHYIDLINEQNKAGLNLLHCVIQTTSVHQFNFIKQFGQTLKTNILQKTLMNWSVYDFAFYYKRNNILSILRTELDKERYKQEVQNIGAERLVAIDKKWGVFKEDEEKCKKMWEVEKE
ncbi:Ankyrin_repeat protein 1 [Hexamita inflata]|uniref:Ankyrin repeat protein 1 n=1 Tax=Hexamita inflata TaxID=28002 RepID=A0AA86NQJ6_9EUKA|nr:Ankyrin repeat protein 1 [Hexamita inflata]